MSVRPSLWWTAYPAMEISAGATSPNPGRPGVYAWSTTEPGLHMWNGVVWSPVITLHDLNALLADGAFQPPRYECLVGDGESTAFTVEHNLGTRSVAVVVFDASSGAEAVCTKTRATDNTVVVGFATPPAASQYCVLIQV